MKSLSRYICVLLLVFAVSHGVAAQRTDAYGEQLGTVHFPVSCAESAKRPMERGLALLHHMTYEAAERAFSAATEADPACAMGYWGQAMSYIHPLWSDPPDQAKFQRGQALLDLAKRQGQKTKREQAYIAALEAYYGEGWNRDETANLSSFEQAWERIYRRYPKDQEAAAFYALAHLATVDRSDKTYGKQKHAGTIAAQILAQIPQHPGAHHYLIHANDHPSLASRALTVARSYAKVAPEVPHALHMPTHIFTRLGLWQESIAWNQRSAAAALNHPEGGATSMHYLHALDYLTYAYLQSAQDHKAKQVLDTLAALEGPFQIEIVTSYTFAAVPARLALERQRWAAAAALEPRTPSAYPWEQFPATEAITHFARALGAARSGNKQVANQALEKLAALREQAAKTSAYWAQQIEIQRLSAQAWLMREEDQPQKALETMQRAAQLEAATEKHPVTPGEILPAREMLADMLLGMGHYGAAQTEYEAALKRSPNRFNSLYGAGRAAELVGNKQKAAHYYRQLTKTAANADTELERLRQAKAFLAADQAKIPS